MDSKVAIITRTKDRSIFLERCFNSINGQSYKDFEWVIVNDGGDRQPVEKVAKVAEKAGMRVNLNHNEESKGMEAASNIGVKASSSEYIMVHDDDDTIEPTFLEEMLKFIESNALMGAVCYSSRVDEKIVGGKIKITGRRPYNGHLDAIYLADVLEINPFTPISFLFKREVFNEIGLFNEELPVIGDWEFHLRFLQKYDIGLLKKFLANYHHRMGANTNDVMGNSVIAGAEKHTYYDMMLRNYYLRKDLASGQFGIGCMMGLMRHFGQVKGPVGRVDRIINFLIPKFLIRLVRNIIKK
ncbi:MAG: glycosyltransferase family 2 protein [Bacteroidetes bacterium]|nr:glycosyltransferase family 2 protein [Bacteroidota bacterium]